MEKPNKYTNIYLHTYNHTHVSVKKYNDLNVTRMMKKFDIFY